MESIRQAVERARLENMGLPRRRKVSGAAVQTPTGLAIEETEVRSAVLLSKRIVSHNGADQRARPYDILRTQVLQSMAQKGWKTLGVTSPTPGCGKTVTAVNLALSIARQPDQSVVLVDMDFNRARVADCLGLKPVEGGVLHLLEERTTLQDTIIPIRAGNQRIAVLPTTRSRDSSELMSSRPMRYLLQDLSANYRTTIIDLPPVLSSDEVIAILPLLDCILLVAAVGHSKASEVEECIRHLQPSQIVRVVLNKSSDAQHYGYY
jgi:Mrp family chromosome partitioning ATPase